MRPNRTYTENIRKKLCKTQIMMLVRERGKGARIVDLMERYKVSYSVVNRLLAGQTYQRELRDILKHVTANRYGYVYQQIAKGLNMEYSRELGWVDRDEG